MDKGKRDRIMASKDELYNILNRMKKDIWLLVKQYNIKDIEVEIDDGLNISHVNDNNYDEEVSIKISI